MKFEYAKDDLLKYSCKTTEECIDMLKQLENNLFISKEELWSECERIAHSRVYDLCGYEAWLEYPHELYLQTVSHNIMKVTRKPYKFYIPTSNCRRFDVMPSIVIQDTMPIYNTLDLDYD